MAVNYAKSKGVAVVVWQYATIAKPADPKQKKPKHYGKLFDKVISEQSLKDQVFDISTGTMGIFVKGGPSFIEQNCNT